MFDDENTLDLNGLTNYETYEKYDCYNFVVVFGYFY